MTCCWPRPGRQARRTTVSLPSSSSISTGTWPRSASAHPPCSRAHAYVGQVIALASGLLARGAAYERAGQVYFRGGDVPDRDAALRLAAEYGDRPGDPARDDPSDV